MLAEAAAVGSREAGGVGEPVTAGDVRNRNVGLVGSDARRLRTLDEENRRLKKLLAEAMLDVSTLREALGKNV